MDLDPVANIARLSTAVTARVLRQIADALDAQDGDDTPTPLVIHVQQLTVNEAAPRLFGRASRAT